jgi:rRNA-processing protein FCF1
MKSETAHPTLLARLQADIADFAKAMDEHLSQCVIRRREEHNIPGVFVLLPPYTWRRNDPTDSVKEMELRQNFMSWYESFELLFAGAGEQLSKDLVLLKDQILQWVERDHGFYVPSSIEEAKKDFRAHIHQAAELLVSLCETALPGTILIPDTNALCIESNFGAYSTIAGSESFLVMLMPTVLGELEKLKSQHRVPELRQKADKAIQRIKGLRNQGNLNQGVTINKTIQVCAIAKEPDFNRTLNWLDKDNFDDRIIASALEIQRAKPAAAVILVTGDINLQNKAAAAKLPFAEPPVAINSTQGQT